MISQKEKDQLIEWISGLDDPLTLETIYALKQSHESPVNGINFPKAPNLLLKKVYMNQTTAKLFRMIKSGKHFTTGYEDHLDERSQL